MHELHRKHRPTLFKQLVGQPDAVKVLSGFHKTSKIPHAILLHGPSGVGKTTCAYIIRDKLECGQLDFREMNCANTRGIDTVREIQSQMQMSPLSGKVRMWLLDEVHQTSRDAQSAMMVPLEQCPSHVYFILATTDPDKLLDTIRGRCTMVKFHPVKEPVLEALVKDVAAKEGKSVSDKLARHIAEAAGGSAREALNFLDKVIDLESDDDKFAVIVSRDLKRAAFDVVKELLWSPHPSWIKLARIVAEVDRSNPEGLRHLILANTRKELLKCDKRTEKRAFAVLLAFEKNWHDSKDAGLEISCYDCFRGLKE